MCYYSVQLSSEKKKVGMASSFLNPFKWKGLLIVKATLDSVDMIFFFCHETEVLNDYFLFSHFLRVFVWGEEWMYDLEDFWFS